MGTTICRRNIKEKDIFFHYELLYPNLETFIEGLRDIEYMTDLHCFKYNKTFSLISSITNKNLYFIKVIIYVS